MARWAKALCNRHQAVLFAPTLDDSLSADHSVRLFDEILQRLDFTSWEREYFLHDGQPPIHPRVMAAVLIYGLSLGIRSSRKLEDATVNRVDFLWLTEGRSVDHSTLAGFRVKFATQIKALFRQVGRLAIGMGLVNLNQLSLDGTTERANNARSAMAGESTIQRKLAALDEQIERLFKEAADADRREDELFGESSPGRLPRSLQTLQSRQKLLTAALKNHQARSPSHDGEVAAAESAAPQAPGGKPPKRGPRVPTTDPDCTLLKNKHGGFAPNYTMTAAVESGNGLIVDCDVLKSHDEPGSVLPTVDRIEENFGQPSQKAGEIAAPPAIGEDRVVRELLADGNFNTGANLQGLQARGIEPYMPGRQVPAQENPAERADATAAVAEDRRDHLPMSPQNKVLDRSAFLYDAASDSYRCPMGRALNRTGTRTYAHGRSEGEYRVYESSDCSHCPLAARCVKNRGGLRRLMRDEYEELREAMSKRMRSPEGKVKYRKRSHLSETPFAAISTVMGVRQMLLRGIENVKTEWHWICTAYNVKKLVARLRATPI